MTLDLAGKRFGRWSVIVRAGVKRSYATWLCRCDCGNEKVMSSQHLRDGGSKSCGCLQKEGIRQRSSSGLFSRRVHGMTGTPIFDVWANMRQRCREHPSYAGRGIVVCERWQQFANFYADMGDAPQGMQIERKNNDGPYSPDNCVWADRKTQARNRRSSRLLEFRGVKKSLPDWADEIGISDKTLRTRINQLGWPVDRALTAPLFTRSQ